MNVVLILFWGAAGLLLYTVGLFPLLVLLRAWWRPRPFRPADVTPPVSVIIAARNEAGNIQARLDNLLSLDYPRQRLEILVASDGSDDGTDDVVRRYTPDGVRLLALPRQGKIPALNAAAAASSGEILVFSDANTTFGREALSRLVRPLADPSVGGVAGDQRFLSGARGGTREGEHRYWDAERWLKGRQSQAGSVTSATGAIYAVRKSLFLPIPPGVTDDFAASTAVILQGFRLVFAPDAVAFEPVTPSTGLEFERKVRVITQGLLAVWERRALLNPARYRFYALQLFTHKVLRRLLVFPLLILALTSPLLWGQGWLYQSLTLLQSAVYGSALLGLLLRGTAVGRHKVLTLPMYLTLVCAACLVAVVNLLRGHRIQLWEPQRAEAASAPRPSVAVRPPEQRRP